jgi:putative SOS response-associated peptidase YedK
MCGRFGFVGSEEDLRDDYPNLEFIDPIVTGYNLGPGRKLSVVLPGGKPALRSLTWGLRTERIQKPLINVRAEGISRHRLFGPLLTSHRCVVPATHFMEWLDDSEPRQPFVVRFPRTLGEPRAPGRFALAAIELNGTFAILTTKATGKLADIHGRMPIVLRPNSATCWLNPEVQSADRLRAAAVQVPVGSLEVYAVGLAVNDVRKEGPALIEPLPSPFVLRDRERRRYH